MSGKPSRNICPVGATSEGAGRTAAARVKTLSSSGPPWDPHQHDVGGDLVVIGSLAWLSNDTGTGVFGHRPVLAAATDTEDSATQAPAARSATTCLQTRNAKRRRWCQRSTRLFQTATAGQSLGARASFPVAAATCRSPARPGWTPTPSHAHRRGRPTAPGRSGDRIEFDQVWRNTTTVDVEVWNPDTAATITHPQMTAESRPSASRLPDLVFQPAKGWRNAGSEAIVDRR